MKINIITVGKIKEKFMKEAIKEFQKRLSRYCKLNIIELDDEKAPEKLSQKDMDIIKDKEGQRILSKIDESSYIITLEIKGKNPTSDELAEKLENIMVEGNNHITFIIGGSLGLSKEVLSRSNYRLSFSKMTFPHQLMRLILLEQIYRSFRIIKNEPYHK